MAKQFDLAKPVSKGERFPLAKNMDEALELIRVDLTWESEADLDAEAFLLGDEGTIIEDADFVYYNSQTRAPLVKDGESDEDYLNRVAEEPFDKKAHGSKKHWQKVTAPLSFDESVVGSFDDPGADDEEEEAGETIRVNLEKVRPEIEEIVFTVTIHHPDESDQTTFQDVKNARIVITDAKTGDALCAYNINEDFSSETALVAGSIKRNDDGDWEFEAIGKGYNGGLQTLVDLYC